MLHELNQPALIEVVEKAADIGVQYVVHLFLQERIRQRIQRIMLAAPRAKTIREAEKILFVNLVEDGSHGVLDDLIFQRRNSQWALPSICFLYVHSSRWHCSVCSAMDPGMKIDQPILDSVLVLVPSDPVHSGCGSSLQRVEAFPQQINSQMVEQAGELHLLVFLCCFPHARQPL